MLLRFLSVRDIEVFGGYATSLLECKGYSLVGPDMPLRFLSVRDILEVFGGHNEVRPSLVLSLSGLRLDA